jgi:hypothetical protein
MRQPSWQSASFNSVDQTACYGSRVDAWILRWLHCFRSRMNTFGRVRLELERFFRNHTCYGRVRTGGRTHARTLQKLTAPTHASSRSAHERTYLLSAALLSDWSSHIWNKKNNAFRPFRIWNLDRCTQVQHTDRVREMHTVWWAADLQLASSGRVWL